MGKKAKQKKPKPKKVKAAAPEKHAKIDGINPSDLRNIHRAVRQAWSWSHVRKLAIKRATGKDGFQYCENIQHEHKGKPVSLLAPDFHHTRRVPKLTVDHIVPVGEVGGRDYIQKMWTPSKNLRAICPKCHYKKTREDAVSHLCMVHGEKCPEGCKRV